LDRIVKLRTTSKPLLPNLFDCDVYEIDDFRNSVVEKESQTEKSVEKVEEVSAPYVPLLEAKFVRDVNLNEITYLQPGSLVSKSWIVSNSGLNDWPEGVLIKCVFSLDDSLLGSTFPTLSCLAGQQTTVSVEFILTENSDRHTSFWKLVSPSGELFGDYLRIDINIGEQTDLTASSSLCFPYIRTNLEDDQSSITTSICTGDVLLLHDEEVSENELPELEEITFQMENIYKDEDTSTILEQQPETVQKEEDEEEDEESEEDFEWI